MSNVKNIWHMILGMPKTIYFNLVCFGIDGLIFPCILSDRVKLISLRGGGKNIRIYSSWNDKNWISRSGVI